jgi:hypothetical protein
MDSAAAGAVCAKLVAGAASATAMAHDSVLRVSRSLFTGRPLPALLE